MFSRLVVALSCSPTETCGEPEMTHERFHHQVPRKGTSHEVCIHLFGHHLQLFLLG